MATSFRSKAFSWISLILLTLWWPAHAAEAPSHPDSFEQQLRVTSDGVPFALTATRRLTRQADGSWQLELLASNWLGEIREQTRFRWQDCTPVSTSWAYSRKGLGQKRKAVLTLNRADNLAVSLKDDRTRRYPIKADTTDKLSQTLALQCLLEQGNSDLVLDVADEREREQVTYQVIGEEWLDTAAGHLRAVRVERVREADSARQTLLWFAPDHQHALVRLVQVEDDKRHQMDILQLP